VNRPRRSARARDIASTRISWEATIGQRSGGRGHRAPAISILPSRGRDFHQNIAPGNMDNRYNPTAHREMPEPTAARTIVSMCEGSCPAIRYDHATKVTTNRQTVPRETSNWAMRDSKERGHQGTSDDSDAGAAQPDAGSVDSDLAEVVAAWPTLGPAEKAAILAVLRSVSKR
jgi:hypothetical protein